MANKQILKGMSQIVNVQNVKSGVNYEEIEKKMLNSGVIEQPKDPTENFKTAINDLARNLNLNFETPKKTPAPKPASPHRVVEPPRRSTPRTPPRVELPRPAPTFSRDDHKDSRDDREEERSDDDRDDKSDSDDGDDRDDRDDRDGGDDRSAHRGTPTPPRPAPMPQPMPRFSPRPPSYSQPQSEFARRTREQERHAQIRNVMQEDGGDPDADVFTVEKEKMEDTKTSMLVEIDSLWAALEEDNEDLSRVPRPGRNSSFEEVENVLKTLRMKLDRTRYCSLADEVVMAMAGVVEDVFDGKRVFFNKYSPDMTGWSKQVAVKLRRMKHDTSTIVGNVMNDYQIGPGMRICLELVPNAFMHARSKRNQFGAATIYSEPDINRSISNIRNIEDK